MNNDLCFQTKLDNLEYGDNVFLVVVNNYFHQEISIHETLDKAADSLYKLKNVDDDQIKIYKFKKYETFGVSSTLAYTIEDILKM
jgi:hypothetical protein